MAKGRNLLEVQRRLIEEILPIKEISSEATKERTVTNLVTLHTWWARKPLSSSRATAYAALVPYTIGDESDLSRKMYVSSLANWHSPYDKDILSKAKKEILESNHYKAPKILDPFSGGGSIPLEALRLGCDTYASDYNPVSVMMLKCTLEYPQKFGNIQAASSDNYNSLKYSENRNNPLSSEVKKWGDWVLSEAMHDIGGFYNQGDSELLPVGYVWARTIKCQNPMCGKEIYLVRNYWLAKKKDRDIVLYPSISAKSITFRIIDTKTEKLPDGFDPSRGTISKAVVTCLICGSKIDGKTTALLFRQGRCSQKMIAILLQKRGKSGKIYRVVTEKDVICYNNAHEYLQQKKEKLMEEWGIDPVPDEPTPKGKGRGAERAFAVRNYGLNTWGELFNSRQKLALVIFVDKVRKAYDRMLEENYNVEYATAIVSYLALAIDRLAEFNSTLCILHVNGGRGVNSTFVRQTLPMVWNYTESNPFNPFGAGWPTACEKCTKWIESASMTSGVSATVSQCSATSLPYPDNYFDAVFTDPPYYDNVPYSHLADFFYVWLKRSIGHLYPDLFSTPLSPKSMEVVAYSNMAGGWEAGKLFFENLLRKSFTEISRILKPNGIALIVYAHKSTAGWETLINSLLESGLVVTAAWPISTEMKARLRAADSAALASSIYIVTRKMRKEKTGFYREVKEELKRYLNLRLDKLWNDGIAGADFFISAVGSSIEVYGRYEKIIDDEGNTIRADRFLEIVRTIVTDYAVHKILRNGFAEEISKLTRFYILWRWSYGESNVLFDDARKLAQSVGIDLIKEWNEKDGLIMKEKEFIKVLGPEDRKIKDYEKVENWTRSEMIDILHIALLIWKKGRKDLLVKLLGKNSLGNNDIFYRVAQAISESLPNMSREKKLLEGFLAGKEKISEVISGSLYQRKLFD